MSASKLIKLEDLKDESAIIFDSTSHNGFPLLNSLVMNFLNTGSYSSAIIVTNNKLRWEDIITNSSCDISYREMFNLSSLTSLDTIDSLLVIDNIDFLLEKFGGQETIASLLRSKRILGLLHEGLQTDSTLYSLKAISPFAVYLDLIEETYVATTFRARPPRLIKHLEVYQISPSFKLTSSSYNPVTSKIQGVISRTKKPSSTFRLETNAEEEAVRTMVANPFLDGEESVSEYVTGKGSSDSESDPDDDLNV